jgi:OOP family OmpA-OmpF porin
MGAKVDAKGCPVDSDGDGVADYMDKCPNTPAGIKVNAEGCPILFEPGKTAVVLQGVNFASNSAVLDPSSQEILDKVANFVQYNPSGYKLEVAGYTSSTGTRAHNMRLSQQRAEAVVKYLESKGVPAGMLTAKGYGPDFPIDTNATAAGRANNRRVELKQIK